MAGKRNKTLWKARGKNESAPGPGIWGGFLAGRSSLRCCFLRCFRQMGCWQKMVRPGVGNTQNKVRGARVLPGASPVEGLDIEVYRCQKDPSGPVHQTLLLTTRGRVTLGHLRPSSSAHTSPATRSLLGTPRQALFV